MYWWTPFRCTGTGRDRSIKENKKRFGNVADVDQTSVWWQAYLQQKAQTTFLLCFNYSPVLIMASSSLAHIGHSLLSTAPHLQLNPKPEKNLIPITVTTTTTTVKELQRPEGWKQRLIKTENPIHALYPNKSPSPHFPDDKTLFQIETKIFDLFPRVDSNLQ